MNRMPTGSERQHDLVGWWRPPDRSRAHPEAGSTAAARRRTSRQPPPGNRQFLGAETGGTFGRLGILVEPWPTGTRARWQIAEPTARQWQSRAAS